ncbi:MAG TPA: PAS domain S-box protein [Methylibium sp.]|nr:PAS domain S-box protein [Methylibium sp.]
MKPALPLSWKLSLLPAAVALLLVASVLALADRLLGRHLEDRAKDQVGPTALRVADAFSRALSRRVGEVQLLARSEQLGPGVPPARMREELAWLQRHTAGYAWLGVTDLDGRVLAATGGLLEGRSIAARPVFLHGLDGPWLGDLHPAVALAPPLPPTVDGHPPRLIDIAAPLIDASGRRYGVLAAQVDGQWFQQLLGRATPTADGLSGTVLSHTGAPLLGTSTVERTQALRDALALRPEPGRWFEVGGRAARQVAAAAPLEPASGPLALGWQIVVQQDLDATLAPVTALQRGLVGGGLLVALGFGVGGWRLSRRLSQPDDLLGRVSADAPRLRAMLDQLPAALYLSGPDDRLLYWNSACEAMFGWSAAEALGRPARELAPFQDEADPTDDATARTLAQAAQDGRGEFEGWCRKRDGSRFWGDVLVYRIGTAEAPGGYAQITRDLSVRREAEKRRREREAMLAAMIQSASDAVISTDVQGRIELVNPAAERIFGRPADALLGRSLEFLLPPGQRSRHGADMAAFAASHVTRRSMGAGRVQGLHADGALIELEASISQVRVNERQVLTAILRDVTDRVRAEQSLMQSQLELTELTQRLMAQEKETTRRLAQALHDRLGQTLAALRLGLDALPGAGAARERLDRQVAQAIGEVREVLAELRPPLLDEQGLAAALDNEVAARYPLPEGVDLVLDVAPALAAQRWPADVEYAAFMIAREAIGNALLHAGAALVRVSIDGDAQRLALEVDDDGSGLAPEFAGGRPGHLGLVGMRERALAIRARFEVQAPPGEGTSITLSWEDER